MKTRFSIKNNFVCIFILLISFLILIYRCFYGFAWNDEPFYLSTANRFYLGERLIIDEWNSTQLSTLLILPFLVLFRGITGSTEGIILFFRLLYVLSCFLIALYSYIRLSKYNKWSSLGISLSILFYAKLSIGIFSYNTLSVLFLYLTLLIFYCNWKEGSFSAVSLTLAGLFFSCAVLSIPFLAVGYFLYAAAILCLIFKTRDMQRRQYKRLFLFPTIGVLLALLAFLLYFLPGTSFAGLAEALPNILNSSAGDKRPFLIRFIGMFGQVARPLVYTMPFYLLTIAYLAYKRLFKKQITPKCYFVVWMVQLICLVVNLYIYSLDERYCGVHFIALGMFGVSLLLMIREDTVKELLCWFVPGCITAALFYFASNTGLIAIAAGCLFIGIGTFMILPYFFQQAKETPFYKELCFITILCCVAVVSITAAMRFFYLRDHKYPLLTAQITEGPAKGIYTAEDNAREYTEILHVIQNEVAEEDQFFISQMACWAYLATDAECGAFTTWEIPLSHEYLETFYTLNPQKTPNVVFVINKDYGYRNNDNPRQGYLYDELLNTPAYEKTEYDCGTLYKRVE